MKKYISVNVEYLSHYDGLPELAYAEPGDAGFDLRAACLEDVVIQPYQRALVPCGVKIAIPEHYELQIRPRSGLALKHGVSVVNSPGTIDSGYRGEIMALLINQGDEPFEIKRGERIAQAVVAPVTQAVFSIVEELDETKRGEGGFGSTGTA
jgi:dUTP pyrophosphatase